MKVQAVASTCKLCGLPTQASQMEQDGHAFCCFGCREVYRCFGDIGVAENNEPKKRTIIAQPEGTEAFLRIDGMHCASCEFLIEKIGIENFQQSQM